MDRIEELKNDLENYYKEIKAKIEELKKKEPKKRWRAKRNETYYLIYGDLNVANSVEGFNSVDDARYKYRNHFKTYEQAKKVAERIKIYMELKDLAEGLNGGKKIDWNNRDERKYSIIYDYAWKKIRQLEIVSYRDIVQIYCRDIGQIYCLDKRFLEIAKERIGEDRLKKLFEEE